MKNDSDNEDNDEAPAEGAAGGGAGGTDVGRVWAVRDEVVRGIADRAAAMLGGAQVGRLAESLAERHRELFDATKLGRAVDIAKLVGIDSVAGSLSSFGGAISAVESARSIMDNFGVDKFGVGSAFDMTKLPGMESVTGPLGASASRPWMTAATSMIDPTKLGGPSFDIGRLTGIDSVTGPPGVVAATRAMEAARSVLDGMAAGHGVDVTKPWITAASMYDPMGAGSGFDVTKMAGFESPFGVASAEAAREAAARLWGAAGAAGPAFRWADVDLGGGVAGLSGLVNVGAGWAGSLPGFAAVRESQGFLRDAMWAGSEQVSGVNAWLRGVHESAADTVWRWSMPDHGAWMDRVMRGPADALAEALRSWSSLAGRGVWQARVALMAALGAVAAIKRGDRDAVKQFLLDWLRFQFVSWDLVSSATLVLLDVRRWLPDGVAEGYDPCDRLRRLTLVEHRRAKRLITDPRLRAGGGPVRSLSEPVRVSDVETKPLLEVLPDRAAPDPAIVDEDEISDPRVLRVWWKLTDREREIVREKGEERMSWPAAAVACGGTPAEGERLRRKVKRLSKTSPAPPSADRAAG